MALAALLVLTACGGETGESAQERPESAATSTEPAQPPPTSQAAADAGLRDALAEVSGTGPAAAYFEYGEPAWWREMGVTGASGEGRRWLPASLSGLGDLARAAKALPEATGIDPAAGERAVTIGLPPRQAFRFDGDFDAAAVRGKLTALGAQPRRFGGHDGLSFSPGAEVDLSRRLVPGVTSQLNQVVATGTTIAAAPMPQSLEAVLGKGPSLADSPDHAAVAECLGDVAAAMIIPPQAPGTVTLYAAGLRRPAALGDAPVNVVCVLPAASAVPAVERALTAGLATSGRYGEHVRQVAHDRVRAGDRTVLRAVLTLREPTHVLFGAAMLQRGELQALAAGRR
ncbi:hypothetical protein GCM10023259_002970 [Thermocatellispora tengchongensis]